MGPTLQYLSWVSLLWTITSNSKSSKAHFAKNWSMARVLVCSVNEYNRRKNVITRDLSVNLNKNGRGKDGSRVVLELDEVRLI